MSSKKFIEKAHRDFVRKEPGYYTYLCCMLSSLAKSIKNNGYDAAV